MGALLSFGGRECGWLDAALLASRGTEVCGGVGDLWVVWVDVPLLASRGSDSRRRGWLADGVGGGDSVNLGAWIARAAKGR